MPSHFATDLTGRSARGVAGPPGGMTFSSIGRQTRANRRPSSDSATHPPGWRVMMNIA